jgi:regulatory protein
LKERSTYDRALTLLGFRARSVAELRRHLLRVGEPAGAVEETITRLESQGLLDDPEFARQFARSRLASKGASRRRIVQELVRRGVQREVADAAVNEVSEDEGIEFAEAARVVAMKKWKSLSALDEFTRKRRLYAFLARRGFDPDEIREVMSAIGTSTDA